MTHLSDIERRILASSRPLDPNPLRASPRLEPAVGGIRAVIFDIYGTLLVSGSGDVGTIGEENSSRAAVEAFGAVGLRMRGDGSAVTDILKETIGSHHRIRCEAGSLNPEVDIRDVWRDVCAELAVGGILERRPDSREIELLAVEYECRNNPVWPMPGMLETVSGLRRRGLLLGIVSNAQFFTPLIMEALFRADLITLGFGQDRTVFSYELLEAKPSVSLFTPVVESLDRESGVSPEEALYVGNDMRNDILPSSSLGMKTALFAGDARSYRRRTEDSACRGLVPDFVVTDLRQILELV